MRSAGLLIAISLAWPAVAHADIQTSQSAQLSIDFPKDWKVTVDAKDDAIRAVSKDSAVLFVFWVIDTADLDTATRRLHKEMFHVIAGQKWEQPRTAKLNSLPVTYLDGTGQSGSKPLDLRVGVVGPTASKKGVILFAAIDTSKKAAHDAEVKAVFDSVKPAKN
jgi:hypothetical protein